MSDTDWAKDEKNFQRHREHRNKQRIDAETQYELLSDPEENVYPRVPYHLKKKIPGGNQTLPVSSILLAPNGADFWHEDMPSYVLEILDETRTNGYVVDGDQIRLLADDSGDGRLRAKYARLALLRAGAVELE